MIVRGVALRYVLVLGVLGGVPGMMPAQELIDTFHGGGPNAAHGTAFGGEARLDGEPTPDFVIGAPGDAVAGTGAGAVFAYAGIDGGLLWDGHGLPGDDLGRSVAILPDLTADGRSEVLVGAPRSDLGGMDSGAVFLLCGRTGTPLFSAAGSSGDLLGFSVVAAGDLDGDGTEDFAAGAPNHGALAVLAGRVCAWSGADGRLLWRIDGSEDLEHLGWSLASVGDLDGDGCAELLAGAPGRDAGTGAVLVLKGCDGAALHQVLGSSANAAFGTCVAAAGDVDLDGTTDWLAGAPLETFAGGRPGSVTWISGATAAALGKLHGLANQERFGAAIAAARDVNADGFEDHLVGAPAADGNAPGSGRAWLIDGRHRNALYVFEGERSGDRLGAAVGAAGDLDRDGHPDVFVGAPFCDEARLDDGKSYLFAGGALFLDASHTRISFGQILSFTTASGAAGLPTQIVLTEVGGTPRFTPVFSGVFDPAGQFRASVPLLPLPGLSGVDLAFRAVALTENGRVVLSSAAPLHIQ